MCNCGNAGRYSNGYNEPYYNEFANGFSEFNDICPPIRRVSEWDIDHAIRTLMIIRQQHRIMRRYLNGF